MSLITITQTTLKPDVHYTGEIRLRGWYTKDYQTNDFISIIHGNGQSGFYVDELCSINGSGELVIPQFQTHSTDDGEPSSSRFIGQLFVNGAPKEFIFGTSGLGWRVPAASATLTRDQWARDNAAFPSFTSLPRLVFTQAQTILEILSRIASTLPMLHASTHQNGGSDEINVTGLSGLLADQQVPSGHAPRHQDGGNDEINVTGLTGLLLTPQIPISHASSHQNGGSDEISVTGLSGLLVDSQTPLAHKTSHENNGADEISVTGLSGQLADPQTPLAHKTSHQSGGSDVIKLDDLAAPDDNTDLNSSASAHGLLPKLSNIVTQFLNGQGGWTTPVGSGGDVVGPGAASDNAVSRFDGTTGKLVQNSNLTLPDDAASTEVGYMNIPQNSQSANYTTVLADRGKHIFHPASDNNPRTFTIDSNANVAYPIGTAITFVNKINTLTIAITSDTLTWAQTGGSGSRSLAANGIATALKISSTEWIISGTGLT